MSALNVGSAETMAQVAVMGNMPGPQQTKEGQAGSFQDLMSSIQTRQQATDAVTELKRAETPNRQMKNEPKTGDTAGKPETEKPGEVNKNDQGSKDRADKAQEPEKAASKTDGDKDTTAKTETGEKLEGAVKEIKRFVMAELDISEEDLENVMAALGITDLDLLNPQTIPQIVTQINDTDIAAVIADESLSGTVQELMGEVRTTVAEVAQELNMTPEEFTAAVEAAKAAPVQTPDTGEAVREPVKQEVDNEKVFTLERPETNLISDDVRPLKEEAVRTPAEAADRNRVNVDKPDGQPEGNEIRVEVERTAGEEAPRHEEGRSEHHEGQQSGMSLFNQNLANAVNEAVNSSNTSEINPVLSYEEVRNIMNQVESAVRVRVTEETQSMEMQLNPANLGRVGLQIVSRAGAITAQFEATNASVKEALEAQVGQLRKQLEEQGLKVESVEVTLRERGFEQNFLNNGQGQQQNMSDTPGRSGRLRRILFDPEAEGEELSGIEPQDEAEALTRRMMRLSGNRVDFMA